MTRAALVAVADGTASLAGQDSVRRLIAAVADRLPEVDVRLAYLAEQAPGPDAALAAVPAGSPVVLVPLAVSVEHPLASDVDLATLAAGHPDAHVAAPLGPDPRVARVLAARLREQRADAFGPDASDAVVLALGGLDPAAHERQAGMLADELRHAVVVGHLTATDPQLARVVDAARARRRLDGEPRRVAVVSGVLAAGHLHDLALRAGGDLVTRPLLGLDEPAPELIDLVVDRYRDALDGPVSSGL